MLFISYNQLFQPLKPILHKHRDRASQHNHIPFRLDRIQPPLRAGEFAGEAFDFV